MKKNLIYALAIITTATVFFLKANHKTQSVISDTILDNVEALADYENENHEYFCFGSGSVICPYSGELVGGFYKRRNIE